MKASLITVFILSLSLACSGQTSLLTATGSKSLALAAGEWGGEHIAMTITAEGADFEFDCASGRITTPLAADAHGHFSVKGTYKVERPAAASVDESNGTAVIYSGT